MLIRIFLLTILALATFVGQAAADDYIKPSYPDMVKTLVRFNALSLSDNAVLDDYALITECDIYKAFYKDDFKWNEVRHAILDSVKNNVATFPTRYRYVARWKLDRYDFQTKIFRFSDQSRISNVNSFIIYSVEGDWCDKPGNKLLPRVFRAVIPDPVYMDGLPIGEEDAKKVIELMKQDNNYDRSVWLRFNMRIVFIEPLVKMSEGMTGGLTGTFETGIHYQQSGALRAEVVRLDARLESIDAYEDEDLTKLIYNIQL